VVKSLAAIVLVLSAWTASVLLADADESHVFGGWLGDPRLGYLAAAPSDRVVDLNRRIRGGGLSFEFDPRLGYMPSVVRALDLKSESQVLVFSKTSLQSTFISPYTPRAILFDDSVALAWIPGAPLLELAANNAGQGTVFYALRQIPSAVPQFERLDTTCLTCHRSSQTLGVPGMAVASVPVTAAGEIADGASLITDHRTAFEQRWGGWYLSNLNAKFRNRAVDLASATAAGPAVDVSRYPSPTSDPVALMVLEHQTHFVNLLTRLAWEVRTEADAADVRASVNELVDYALFVNEASMPSQIGHASRFAASFAQLGPRDGAGRSLRDFDLRNRLFRYRCSYMLYSAAFDALPPSALAAVYERLWVVLSGGDTGPAYQALPASEREAVVEILRATKPDLPPFFRVGDVH
jgi:hypothetical protein